MLKWIVNKLLGRKTPSAGYTPPRAATQPRPAVSVGFVTNMTPSESRRRSQFAAIGNTEALSVSVVATVVPRGAGPSSVAIDDKSEPFVFPIQGLNMHPTPPEYLS